MVGLKTRVLEGFFVNASSLENCRGTGQVVTEATLRGSKPLVRISNVGRFTETAPGFQHAGGFNNNKSKTPSPFYHDNIKVTC